MLTQEDLKNIGVELGKVIEENITPTLEQMATKEDLRRVEDRLDSIDSKIAKIQSDLEDIKRDLERLEKRTKEDADVAAKDILELRQRVESLEEKIKQLQLSHG
jgi:chromosome segregation ATPase